MPRREPDSHYTKVPNKLLEALAAVSLCPYEGRVIMYVIRQTYGWNVKTKRLPVSEIARGTGIAVTHVSRALSTLTARCIITRTGNKQALTVQECTELWLQKLPVLVKKQKLPVPVKKLTSTGNKTLPVPVINGVPGQAGPKERKEIKDKDGIPASPVAPETQGFKEWLQELHHAPNKVAVLARAFTTWHSSAPPEDLDPNRLHGRMGKIFTTANRDGGYLLRQIWETAAADIAGSHLSYIQARLKRQSNQNPGLPSGDRIESDWNAYMEEGRAEQCPGPK